MAKLKGPMFSLSAHGKLGRALSFSQSKGRALTKKYSYPKKPATLSQLTQRTIIGLLTAQWSCMSAGDKQTWENQLASTGERISAFNYFIREAQKDLYTHHGLIVYYSMNEKDGATVYDHSGNGLNGTLMPSYPSNCPQRVASINEKFGNALLGDGVDDYLTKTHNAKLQAGTGELTWTATLMPLAVDSGRTVAGKYEWVSTVKGIRFSTAYGPQIEFIVGDGTTSKSAYTPTLALGQWYFIAGTRIGTTLRIYQDAILKDTETGSTHNADNTGPLNILANTSGGGNTYFKIDSFRAYNRGLSQNEIAKQFLINRQYTRRQAVLR